MKFVGHEGINAAFDRLLGNSRLYCAVAFWGYGASKHLQLPRLGRDIRIICNLSMGGTNPDEIRRMVEGGAQGLNKSTRFMPRSISATPRCL